jgi:hypothetical protein
MTSQTISVVSGVVPQAFWFGFAIATSLAALTAVIAYHLTESNLMGINEALAGIKSQLTEASTEIVTKIDELERQISESESVDPQLLDDVKSLAGKLADVVPNAVAGEELTDPIVPGENLTGVRVDAAGLTDNVGAKLTDVE